jgi:hypothetical protein
MLADALFCGIASNLACVIAKIGNKFGFEKSEIKNTGTVTRVRIGESRDATPGSL